MKNQPRPDTWARGEAFLIGWLFTLVLLACLAAAIVHHASSTPAVTVASWIKKHTMVTGIGVLAVSYSVAWILPRPR
jgi:hypothetical protein